MVVVRRGLGGIPERERRFRVDRDLRLVALRVHAELRVAFVNLESSWIIEHSSGGGEPDRVYLCSPLQGKGKTLRHGEKLIFLRSFAGSSRSHFELSQKLVHALDIHY